jgi:cytochrome c5
MSKEQDQIFFRNFSLALGAIATMMVIFFVVAQFAGSEDEAEAGMRDAKVAKLTEPVGQVTVVGEEAEEAVEEVVEEVAAEASAGGETSGDVGKTVYDSLCVNCHGIAAMAAMIPQTGDAAAWGSRIEQGIETLYDHAINGFTGAMGMMPAKGSNPSLSDDEVKAAVDYMVSQTQ